MNEPILRIVYDHVVKPVWDLDIYFTCPVVDLEDQPDLESAKAYLRKLRELGEDVVYRTTRLDGWNSALFKQMAITEADWVLEVNFDLLKVLKYRQSFFTDTNRELVFFTTDRKPAETGVHWAGTLDPTDQSGNCYAINVFKAFPFDLKLADYQLLGREFTELTKTQHTALEEHLQKVYQWASGLKLNAYLGLDIVSQFKVRSPGPTVQVERSCTVYGFYRRVTTDNLGGRIEDHTRFNLPEFVLGDLERFATKHL